MAVDGRTCNKCGDPKPAAAFESNGRMPDGSVRLRSICKACGSRRKLERPEARRCTVCKRKKPATDFAGRESRCRLCTNQKGYNYKRGAGRAAHNTRMAQYVRDGWKNPEFRKKQEARLAVKIAVAMGTLKRPTRCPRCNRKCRVQGHHHKGYDKRHWLDVQWLCASCHYRVEHPT